jgi:hypothetical protein
MEVITVQTQCHGFPHSTDYTSARYFVPLYEVRGQDWNRFGEVDVKDVFPSINPALIVEGHGLHMSFKSCEKHIYLGEE